MRKIILIACILLGFLVVLVLCFGRMGKGGGRLGNPVVSKEGLESLSIHPLDIEYMRRQSYEGSDLVIEETLSRGAGFSRFVASYQSDGLKIKGLLAVPDGEKPEKGFPAIVFNHGYIEPEAYQRETKYVAYLAGFAGSGYMVFMPDYRGHQDSQGEPTGGYFSPGYTIDALNAFSSLKRYKDVNQNNIGMWGHSMGGHITLRSMVVNPEIKAGVIWAGVVASYEDMYKNWRRSSSWSPSPREIKTHRPNRQEFVDRFGEPEDDNSFWRSISPVFFTSGLDRPISFHHGIKDDSVPWEFSKNIYNKLKSEGKETEYFEYPGGDHNLSGVSFSLAMKRSNQFFDRHLKN